VVAKKQIYLKNSLVRSMPANRTLIPMTWQLVKVGGQAFPKQIHRHSVPTRGIFRLSSRERATT
jgi:hypothetical protein